MIIAVLLLLTWGIVLSLCLCGGPEPLRWNYRVWRLWIRNNKLALNLIPFEELRKELKEMVSAWDSDSEPNAWQQRKYLVFSGLVASVVIVTISWALRIHPLTHVTLTGQPGLLVVATIDTSPVPWKWACVFPPTDYPPALIEGTAESFTEVKKAWNFNAVTGHLSSRIPHSDVDVELRFGCFFGVFQWSGGVLHRVGSVVDRREEIPTEEERALHRVYPKIENPVAFVVAVLLLIGTVFMACMFCCWFVVCALAICCVGVLASGARKRNGDEL